MGSRKKGPEIPEAARGPRPGSRDYKKRAGRTPRVEMIHQQGTTTKRKAAASDAKHARRRRLLPDPRPEENAQVRLFGGRPVGLFCGDDMTMRRVEIGPTSSGAPGTQQPQAEMVLDRAALFENPTVVTPPTVLRYLPMNADDPGPKLSSDNTFVLSSGHSFKELEAMGVSDAEILRLVAGRATRSVASFIDSLGFTPAEVQKARDLATAVATAVLSKRTVDIARAVQLSDGIFTSPRLHGITFRQVADELTAASPCCATIVTGSPSVEALASTPPRTLHFIPRPTRARLLRRADAPGIHAPLHERIRSHINHSLACARRACVLAFRSINTIREGIQRPESTGPQLAGIAVETSKRLSIAHIQMAKLAALFLDNEDAVVPLQAATLARATAATQNMRDSLANLVAVERSSMESDPNVVVRYLDDQFTNTVVERILLRLVPSDYRAVDGVQHVQ